MGARLLHALARRRGPQKLKDLAAESRMPAAKAHRYLVSFGRSGLVEQNGESGLYQLGAFALNLGLAAIAELDAVSVVGQGLPALSAETGQTVAIAIWGNHGPTIVRWLGADTPVAATLRLGSVMPLTRSATGQAFLAFMPRSQTRKQLTRELRENARRGLHPSSEAEIEANINGVRRMGYARVNDFVPGISGMSVPVFDHTEQVVLVLVALGYSKPFDASFLQIEGAMVRKAAQMSLRLGSSQFPCETRRASAPP